MNDLWTHDSSGGGFYSELDALGQAEPTPGGPPHLCDFTQEPFVSAIQGTLGVAQTGKWDDATCKAWSDRYGHAPTGAELAAAFPGEACGWLVLPACKEPEQRTLGTMVALGIGGGLVLALLTVLVRAR